MFFNNTSTTTFALRNIIYKEISSVSVKNVAQFICISIFIVMALAIGIYIYNIYIYIIYIWQKDSRDSSGPRNILFCTIFRLTILSRFQVYEKQKNSTGTRANMQYSRYLRKNNIMN